MNSAKTKQSMILLGVYRLKIQVEMDVLVCNYSYDHTIVTTCTTGGNERNPKPISRMTERGALNMIWW